MKKDSELSSKEFEEKIKKELHASLLRDFLIYGGIGAVLGIIVFGVIL